MQRVDSNHRSPAYEASEIGLFSTLQYQGGIFFRSEPPRPHMKGNENRNQRLVNNYKYFSVTADWKNTYSVVSLLEEVCIEIVAIHFSSLLPHRS